MKKILLPFMLCLAILAGCSSDGDGDTVNNNNENSVDPNCSKVTDFTVQQQSDIVNFAISQSASAMYFEVSYSPAASAGAENGYKFTLSAATASKKISEIQIAEGEYMVFVRSICGDNSKSAWFGPKPLTVKQYCPTPKDVYVADTKLGWFSDETNSTASIANYQIQYGLQGFRLGDGVQATVNGSGFENLVMQQGKTYDIYVRAYCGNTAGYGNWTAPLTYYAQSNINMCTQPSNINASINGGSAHFTWDRNGETKFEYTVVERNYDVSTGQIEIVDGGGFPLMTIRYIGQYDFYVRAVCLNGNRTAWVKRQFSIN